MSQDFVSQLYHASRHGLWRSVKILIDHGMDVNASSGSHGTAIEAAARYGHERVVELLISHGGNVNSQYRHNPLIAAVQEKQRSVVWQLLENGADVNSRGRGGWGLRCGRPSSALELAIKNGDEDIVQMMLDHGMDIHTWWAAMMTALMHGRAPVVSRLLNHHLEATEHRNQCIRDALTQAIMRANAPSVKLLLDQLKSRGGIIDGIGRTPLSYAAETGETVLLRMLMTDPNLCGDFADKNGRTPLSYAAGSGDGAALQMLLEHNDRDIDLADARGRTPLSYAAGMGPEGHETVEMLLDYDLVDANSQDNKGRTPLSYAVARSEKGAYHCGLFESSTQLVLERERHRSMVKMLLDHTDTASETQDQNGWTPLSWAVEADNTNMVELLLAYGGRGVDRMRSNGETLKAEFYRWGSAEMLRLLSEHEVISLEELEDHDHAWNLILHAVSEGHTELVNFLLKHSRLDPRKQDERSRNLISLAAARGNEDTLKLLLSIDSSTVDLPDRAGRTPLSYTFSKIKGRFYGSRAKLLLDTYAVRLDLPDAHCRAPISYAAEAAASGLVKMLLERNVDIDRADNRGRTPLSYAAGESDDDKVVELIFEKSTTAKDFADHSGRTPLSYAAGRGRRGAVRFLLQSGSVKMDAPDKHGLTPLAYAEIGKIKIVRTLPVGGGELRCTEMTNEDHVRTCGILISHGAYRLDIQKLASEEWETDTESSDSEDPQMLGHLALTTPLNEPLAESTIPFEA